MINGSILLPVLARYLIEHIPDHGIDQEAIYSIALSLMTIDLISRRIEFVKK
jgi:hypothetical protein